MATPSVLPSRFRRDILRAAAHKIAGNLEAQISYNISLERFGGADIADVVNELLDKFSGNPNVVEFLLHVVRKGKIAECADRALDIALSESTTENVRHPAIYAVADASAEHAKELAKKVADQADKWTGRDLTNVMLSLFPKSMNIGQFVQCIEKKAGIWHGLADNSYILEDVPLEGMPTEKLRKFLNSILAAAKARAKRAGGWAESLTAMLVAKALMPLLESSRVPHEDEEILRAIEAFEEYEGMGFLNQEDVVTKISANSQLVRALYWRAFQREGHAPWDSTSKMWRLSASPELLQAFLPDIREQADAKKREEAFHIMWQYWRPYMPEKSGVLAKIRASLAGDGAMLRELDERLEQTAKCQRQREQREKNRKERERKEKEAEEQKLHEFIEHLRKMPSQLCDFDAEAPPNVVNDLLCLRRWMRYTNKPISPDERASCCWESMIPVFGEEITRCAQNGMMKFWRTYNPKPISEVRAGRDSWSADRRIFLGMLGLDTLHRQQPGWAAKLTADEAAHAARYATHSGDRFPAWFAELVSEHREAVSEVMRSEMEQDIRQFADNASPNILPAMFHSDETLVKFFALIALNALEENFAMGKKARLYVSRLLRFLKDGDAAERKIGFYCKRIAETDDIDEQSFWLAEWMRVNAGAALEELERYVRVRDISNSHDAKKLMVNFCGSFWDEIRGHDDQGVRETELWDNIGLLLKLLWLTFTHVRVKDDITYEDGEEHSYGTRERAQRFRGALFHHLIAECSGEAAYHAMMELSKHTALDASMHGFLRMRARGCAENDADSKSSAWKLAKVVAFANDITPPMDDPNKFFKWFLLILNELKSDWEGGDFSPKSQIHSEEDAQIQAARDLEKISREKFTVTRENEVIDRKKPDIRIQPCGGDSVVSVEIKIADNWSFHQLQDALETQLPQYLRDSKAQHGILLLVNKGGKKWKNSSSLANFAELTEELGNQAKKLAGNIEGVDDIRVIGVDLSQAKKKTGTAKS